MTYDLDTLKSLKSRIDKATGADRELDVDIAILFSKLIITIEPNAHDDMQWRLIFPDAYQGCGFETGYYDSTKRSKKQLYTEAFKDAQEYEHLENYTSSIDAALALIAQVLPEVKRYELFWDDVCDGFGWKAYLPAKYNHKDRNAKFPNGALALLSATFAALIAKVENEAVSDKDHMADAIRYVMEGKQNE